MKNVTLVRNLVLSFLATFFICFAVAHNASALTANFTWKMHERFGLDATGKQVNLDDADDTSRGVVEYHYDQSSKLYDPSYIQPEPNLWAVDLDASSSTGATYYTWYIDDVSQRISGPMPTIHIQKLGSHKVTLIVSDGIATESITKFIYLKDWLFVSLGDSFASGEGNPDIPGDISSLSIKPHVELGAGPEVTVHVTIDDPLPLLPPIVDEDYSFNLPKVWVDASFKEPPVWQDEEAHRSAFAGPARAAIDLERADPHSSVTFLSFASSGAVIKDLINTDPGTRGYTGQYRDMPPQLDQLATALNGVPRDIDTMTISIGGNDAGFANIILRALLPNTDTPLCIGGALSGLTWEPTVFDIIGSPPPLPPLLPAGCPFVMTPLNPSCDDPLGLTAALISLPALPGIDNDPLVQNELGINDSLSQLKQSYMNINDRIKELFENPYLPSLFRTISDIYVTEYPDPTHDQSGDNCEALNLPAWKVEWQFLPLPHPALVQGCDYWLSQKEFEWVYDNVFFPLNQKVSQSVDAINAENGDLQWKYVDGIANASYIHGVSSDETWFNDIAMTLTGEFDYHGAFHPNRDGHYKAYRDGILAKMLPLLDPIPGSEKPVEVPEGSQYATDVTVIDVHTPNISLSNRTWSLTVDYGDPTSPSNSANWTNQVGMSELPLAHTYASPRDYLVSVTMDVLDSNGNIKTTKTAQATVHVFNVPPTVSAIAGATIDEGGTFTSSGSFTDPGLETWTATVDYGDGSGVQTLPLNSDKTFSLSHAYGDNGNFQVVVTVTDDGGASGSSEATAAVRNVAPSVQITSIQQPYPGFILPSVHTLTYSGTFTDPGWLDTHTSVWAFGDGLTAAGSLTEENISPDSTGSVSTTHAYDEPGTYTVTLTVTDDDGGQGNNTSTLKVISAADAVSILSQLIKSLPNSDFTQNAQQHKSAFDQKLAVIISYISAGDYQSAKKSLLSDVRAKADGLVDGSPNSDWIINAAAQRQICAMIDQIVAYLNTLIKA